MSHPRSPQDGVYRPILRPRRGELTAVQHISGAAAARVMPIFELEPHTPLAALLTKHRPGTPAVGVDLGNVPDAPDPLSSRVLDLAEQLVDLGVALVPVLRPYESRRRLAEHGLAARMHLGRAVLRLQPHVDASNPAEATAAADRVLSASGLAPHRGDLMIDLAETVCVAHANKVEERARRGLRWARGLPWRSVSVASGAMPPNLGARPTGGPAGCGCATAWRGARARPISRTCRRPSRSRSAGWTPGCGRGSPRGMWGT